MKRGDNDRISVSIYYHRRRSSFKTATDNDKTLVTTDRAVQIEQRTPFKAKRLSQV